MIGIGGCTSSGKSTLGRALAALLGCPVLTQESFTLAHPPLLSDDLQRQLSDAEAVNGASYPRVDLDSPACIDMARFLDAVVAAARSGQHQHVIVEGFLLYCTPGVADVVDVPLFLTVPRAVSMERKWNRNHRERGVLSLSQFSDYFTIVEWRLYEAYGVRRMAGVVGLDGTAGVEDLVATVRSLLPPAS